MYVPAFEDRHVSFNRVNMETDATEKIECDSTDGVLVPAFHYFGRTCSDREMIEKIYKIPLRKTKYTLRCKYPDPTYRQSINIYKFRTSVTDKRLDRGQPQGHGISLGISFCILQNGSGVRGLYVERKTLE